MRKRLLILIALITIAAPLMAGVNFTGRFRAGWTMDINSKDGFTIQPYKSSDTKITLRALDDNNIWSITVDGTFKNVNDISVKANMSLSITDLLKYLGHDTKEATFKMTVISDDKGTALSAYNDKAGDGYYKFRNNGIYNLQLQFGYLNYISLSIVGDPTFGTFSNIKDKDPSVAISLLSSPIKGMEISGAFAYNGYQKDYVLLVSNNPNDDELVKEIQFKYGVNGAFDYNIGTALNLKYDLGLSFWDTFAMDMTPYKKNSYKVPSSGDNANFLHVGFYGGNDIVNGYLEYRLGIMLPNNENAMYAHGLKIGLEIEPVTGLTFNAHYTINNFRAIAKDYEIGFNTQYSFSGTSILLNLDIKWLSIKNELTITPRFSISF